MEELNKNIPEQCLAKESHNNYINLKKELDSMADVNGKASDTPNRLQTDSEDEYSSDRNGDSRRKRRSKNDQNGRKYTCECGKSYLSQPALTNHKKTKHEVSNVSAKRGRGRPRKNPNLVSGNKDNTEARMEKFIEDGKRRRLEGEQYRIIDSLAEVFNEIFIIYRNYLEVQYDKPEDNLLLGHIIKLSRGEGKKPEEMSSKNKATDYIFIEYLEYLSHSCNKDYFNFSFKFLLLFRECINKYKNVELVNRREILNEEIPKEVTEYTQYFNADQVPDLCNEFITDFMENANFFGMNSEAERTEFIEVIQHLCYWLFKKSYTSSKLTLLN